MLIVNFKDGTALNFDLKKPDDLAQWLEWQNESDFQNRITGIGIIHEKKFVAMPLPKNFRSLKFYAELVPGKRNGETVIVGERVMCHADQILLSLLVYTYTEPQPPPVFSRFDVKRVGKQMFPGKGLK